MSKPNYSIEFHDDELAFIADADDGEMSITNGAEYVIDELREAKVLKEGVRLFYKDTEGEVDEILWCNKGFVGFNSGLKSPSVLNRLYDDLKLLRRKN